MGFKYINHDNSQFSRGNRINTTDAISLSDFNPGTTPSGLYDGLNASGDLTRLAHGEPWRGPVLSQWPAAGPVQHQLPVHLRREGDHARPLCAIQLRLRLRSARQLRRALRRHNRQVELLPVDRRQRLLPGAEQEHYYKPLPSFNLAYDLDEDKVVRFGVSKVIARPRYSDLAGSVSLNSNGGQLHRQRGQPEPEALLVDQFRPRRPSGTSRRPACWRPSCSTARSATTSSPLLTSARSSIRLPARPTCTRSVRR